MSAAADLVLTQTAAPTPAVAGATLTYTLTLTNAGPDSATAVTVSDTLPTGTTFLACSATGGGVCAAVGNSHTVSFAAIPAGSSVTITLRATVGDTLADGATLTNQATVTSSAVYDPDLGNNTTTTTVTVVNRADLTISMVADKNPVKSGTNLTYTITVQNLGPAMGRAVVVQNALPAGTSFVGASPNCSGPAAGATTGTLTCRVGDLHNGGLINATFTVRVTARNGSTITNTAGVTAGSLDPVSTNNSATVATRVGSGK